MERDIRSVVLNLMVLFLLNILHEIGSSTLYRERTLVQGLLSPTRTVDTISRRRCIADSLLTQGLGFAVSVETSQCVATTNQSDLPSGLWTVYTKPGLGTFTLLN